MSYYVITKIRVNGSGDVVDALVHELTVMPGAGQKVQLGNEVEMSAPDVADLLLAGDQAYVGLQTLEAGFYNLTDEVRSRDDDEQFLESFSETGETSTALTDLPRLT